MLIGMLDHQGVERRTNTALAAVTDEGVEVIEKDLQITSISCDSVVIAVGFKPENSLAQTLEDKKYRVYKIGDCKDPRRILNAVWDAYKIANTI
jgi:2-enoate reductase